MRLLPLLALLGPVAYALVGIVAALAPGSRRPAVLGATRIAALVGVVVAVGLGWLYGVDGVEEGTLAGISWVRVDPISVVMTALVATLGASVMTYSLRYLDGDPRQGVFLGWLAATVGAVMLIVMAGDLLVLLPAWAASSFTLHQLLVFRRDRRRAVVAARKKFLVARVGELALLGAAILLHTTLGTTDLGLLSERAGEASAGQLAPAAALIALAAVLKSAQFPTHGWLVEVMETPTPVSALLHAGIVNGGPFLLIRLAPVMVAAPTVLAVLLVVGAVTCLFASLVMTTQSSVKVALAYSSAAHMGFMVFTAGLGAFSVALLHLVAHSYYKAHAFLSSGSAVADDRAAAPVEAGRPTVFLAGLGLSAAIFFGVGAAFGFEAEDPTSWIVGLLLVLGLTQLVGQALRSRPAPLLVGRAALAAAAVSTAFFSLELGARKLLAPSLPSAPELEGAHLALAIAVLVVFGAVVALQLVASEGRRGRALRVHLRHGLYVNTLFDRLVGAHRR